MEEVAAWLARHGLAKYAALLAEHEIDLEILRELTEADLEKLGLPLGARKKLLKAAALGSGLPLREPAPIAREAERRQLTVMFCDLVGSTALSERLDPEDLRDLVRAYQAVCAEVISRWEGHLAQYLGDGVLAYFGYPLAHEDDAARAVRAGLDMLAGVSRLQEGFGRRHGVLLRVRIGLHTGVVIAGEMGGGGRPDPRAIVGETPNVAARLEAVAEPDTLVVGPTTARLVEDLFDLEPLGPVEIRGLSRPLAAFRVRGERAVTDRFEVRAARGLAPLVGRQAELALLLQRWRHACEGEARVVLLSGDAGIGKSRMLRAFRDGIAAEPHNRILYYCSPHHHNSAFWPAIEQLQRVLRFEPADDAAMKRAKLDASLADLGLETTGHAPALASFLGISEAPKDLPPPQLKKRSMDAIVAMAEALARQRPTLMVTEDAHWLDPSTLELTQRLVERPPDGAFMLLLTGRPDFRPDWSRWPHFHLLALDRLSRRESAVLVARVSGKPLPETVVDQIVARTDGVPLFVEELTKTMLESGLLRDVGDAWTLDGPLPSLAIPSTVHDSLMARLDRIGAGKEIAQIGACIGRSFDYSLLAAVATMDEPRLRHALHSLVEAELLFQHGEPPEASYEFKHALVQDAAYSTLLRSGRLEVHARILSTMEQDPFFGQRHEEMARHAEQSGDVAKAVSLFERAGEEASRRSASAEAAAHFGRALSLLRKVSAAGEEARELSLELKRGPALMLSAGFGSPAVEQSYERARVLAAHHGGPPERFAACWGLWFAHHQRCRFVDADRLAAEALSTAEASKDPHLLLEAHHVGWTTALVRGHFADGTAHVAAGLELYRADAHGAYLRFGAHDPAVCAHTHGGMLHWFAGDETSAMAASRLALDSAAALRHPPSIIIALFGHAITAALCRRVDEVHEAAEEIMEVCGRIDLVQYEAVGRVFRGWAASLRGDPIMGCAEAERGLDQLLCGGTELRRGLFLAIVAECRGRRGETDSALSALDEAQKVAERNGERSWLPLILTTRGDLLSRISDRSGAERSYLSALEASLSIAARGPEAIARARLAELT